MKIKGCKYRDKCPAHTGLCWTRWINKNACIELLIAEHNELKNAKARAGLLVSLKETLCILRDEANKTQNAAAFSALKRAYARVYHLPTTMKDVK